MVTNPQIREQIAKELGWTWYPNGCPGQNSGEKAHWHAPKSHRGRHLGATVPNWPTDRNDSIHLEIQNHARYLESNLDFSKSYPEENDDYIPESARVESLKWLLYKGWRWVEHEKCNGTGAVEINEGDDYAPCDCNGETGEWEKEG